METVIINYQREILLYVGCIIIFSFFELDINFGAIETIFIIISLQQSRTDNSCNIKNYLKERTNVSLLFDTNLRKYVYNAFLCIYCSIRLYDTFNTISYTDILFNIIIQYIV